MATKKGKKGRDKDENWEGDVANEIEAISIQNSGKPDGPKGKNKKNVKIDAPSDSDSESDVEKGSKSKGNKQPTMFSMLAAMEDDDDDDADKSGTSSDEGVSAPQQQQQQQRDVSKKAQTEEAPQQKAPAKKQKAKKKGKQQADEDDIDLLLEELEKKPEPKGKKKKKKVDVDDIEFELEEPSEKTALAENAASVTGGQSNKKLSRKEQKRLEMENLDMEDELATIQENGEIPSEPLQQQQQQQQPQQPTDTVEKSVEVIDKAQEETATASQDEDTVPKVKTAAEKRKEKKEREAEKKRKQKEQTGKDVKKVLDHDKAEEAEKVTDVEPKVEEIPPMSQDESSVQGSEKPDVTEAPQPEPEKVVLVDKEDVGEEAEDDKKDKKKKKKKAKEEKEEKEKKKKGGIGKGALEAMKDALKKAEEEKERVRSEAEEKLRKKQEAEERYLEKVRLEKERKEKKKQKEKERIARKKQEGTYISAEQRQKRQREQERIQMMMQHHGMQVPALENKDGTQKRPKYIDKKKLKKQQQQQQAAGQQPVDGSREATPQEESSPEIEMASPMEEEKSIDDAIVDTWEEAPEVADNWEEEAVDKAKAEGENGAAVDEQEESEGEDESESEESDEEEPSTSEESESEEEEKSSQPSQPETKEQLRDKVVARIKKRRESALAKRSTDLLRSPIVCVLGHVDTGKTKILDKIRRTNVQDGEAGGITQQIGATMVPEDAIRKQTAVVKDFEADLMKIPGLLIIDTPGHESFSNLRSRGSSLCDIAILVVDIMHGLEPQTLESMGLLRKRKTPYIIALNKIDRLYEWKTNPHKDVKNVIKGQQHNTKMEFQERLQEVTTQFAEQGLNVALFYENKDPSEYISLVPTSAHSGDGMANLIAEVIKYSEAYIAERLSYHEDLESTVMEVKALPGLGTTIDVILVNGSIRVGDTMIVAGTEGPIVTQIRELLKPQPLRELRVKTPYEHFKELKGAQGVKILAKDLEKSLAGLPLLIAQKEDELEIFKEEIAGHLKAALQSIKLSDHGVYVQASTLGSLEALLEFLRSMKIPYSGINIGPVHRKDVMKASTMLEHEDGQYAVILAFDVKIERDAQEMADNLGVRLFSADIIYHLFDSFTKFREDWKESKRKAHEHLAVFPCKLKILPQYIFKSRNPIVMGVIVEGGVVKKGTPICVPSKEFCHLGIITSIQHNHKELDTAKQGQEICIKIEDPTGGAPKMYGRHFDENDALVSKITRDSIDVCKQYFRDDLQKADWLLMIELKKLLEIM